MQLMHKGSAAFIDRTMHYLGLLLDSDRIAFYEVADDKRIVDFALRNINDGFHRGYVDGMHAFDPLHVSRLNRNAAPGKIHHLRRYEHRCGPRIVQEYRSFLSAFDITDVFELLFRFEGHVVAGASILYKHSQPRGSEPAHIQAAHAYIEFNLAQYVRQSDYYVRVVLRNRFGLSALEIDVIELICCGRTNFEVGEILKIGVATVKTHLIRVYQKLGVENRASVVAVLAELR